MPYFDLTLPNLAQNLALDEALLIEAEEGRGDPTLRFWESAEYAVVLGASRRLRDEIYLEACLADEIAIGRRSSGGGTVVIGPGALNVSVILPETASLGTMAIDVAQRYVVERFAESISRIGARIELRGLGDLTIGDRKCGGSAQRRLKGWFMVHCSLLYAFQLERIGKYLRMPGRQPDYREGRDHGDFVCNLGIAREQLTACISAANFGVGDQRLPSESTLNLVRTLAQEKYGSTGWTERF